MFDVVDERRQKIEEYEMVSSQKSVLLWGFEGCVTEVISDGSGMVTREVQGQNSLGLWRNSIVSKGDCV